MNCDMTAMSAETVCVGTLASEELRKVVDETLKDEKLATQQASSHSLPEAVADVFNRSC